MCSKAQDAGGRSLPRPAVPKADPPRYQSRRRVRNEGKGERVR